MTTQNNHLPAKRVSIVTGGSQGIGASIATMLSKRGDYVFVLDCVPPHVDKQNHANNIEYLQTNVSQADSVKQAFAHLDSFLQENKDYQLALLVNNAGITRDGLVIRMSEEDFDAVIAVNLKGTFLCAQQALMRMVRQRSGSLINISSVVGLTGNPGQANYAASKAGIIGFTKSLAHEYGNRGIRINAIAPGFIETPMTKGLPQETKDAVIKRTALKHLGVPEDVAKLVLFLSSDDASYITGHVFDISGGLI